MTSAVLANFQHNRNAEIDGLSAIGVFLKCLTKEFVVTALLVRHKAYLFQLLGQVCDLCCHLIALAELRALSILVHFSLIPLKSLPKVALPLLETRLKLALLCITGQAICETTAM